jgi:hypothetical protein
VDGGLNIPHKVKRLAGYDTENDKFDPAKLRKYIFGGHVADYMKKLQKEDPARYQRQFSRYIAHKIDANSLEGMYKKAHAAIRADPDMKKVLPFSMIALHLERTEMSSFKTVGNEHTTRPQSIHIIHVLCLYFLKLKLILLYRKKKRNLKTTNPNRTRTRNSHSKNVRAVFNKNWLNSPKLRRHNRNNKRRHCHSTT